MRPGKKGFIVGEISHSSGAREAAGMNEDSC